MDLNQGDIMTSRNLVAAFLAAAVLAAGAAPASAQNYYMRERIVGMKTAPEVTYVPTYSTSYGSCVGGSQTAPIASCKDSTGKTVANSMCGASAQQSPPKACTSYACGSFSAHGHISGSYTTLGTRVGNDAAAKALCEEYAGRTGTPGGCMRETVNEQNVYYVFNKTAADVITKSYFDQNVAICAKQ
jgi:hypothetical protein